jgi:hypothetical protein
MDDRVRGVAKHGSIARRWVVACLLACGLATGSVASATGPSAAPLPSSLGSYCANQNAIFRDRHPFVGITDGYVEADGSQYRNCTFGYMAANHIGYFRGAISWLGVEYSPGHYNFAPYDRLITDLARHHMQFLAGILETPPWLSTNPKLAAQGYMYPPANPNDLAAFAALCVQRYGPRGTLWRMNPSVPYYPVRAWQIWNEPDLAEYWQPAPDPVAYAHVLRAAYKAIKRVDRRATVVTGGMPFTSVASQTSFLVRLYRGGARGAFDALALHPYSSTAIGAIQRLLAGRKVMNRFGDRRKQLWATEWAWAGGPPSPYTVNAGAQSRIVSSFLKLVQRYRARLRISELMYYGWRDIVGSPPNWWGYNLALFTKGLSAKPAFGTVTAAARRLDR